MIDIDEYIDMWNDHLLDSEGVQDLMNALIAEVERLREGLRTEKNLKLWEKAEVERLRKAIVDMIDSMDNYYIRDIQHATECLRDVIGYYEDDEE